MYIIEYENFDSLLTSLRRRNYATIGPIVRDGAIVLDEIQSANELPRGWHDEQGPASYAVRHESDNEMFGYVVGPQSWKKFLYPPRMKLFTASKNGKGFEIAIHPNGETTRYAFIGVRPCELAAIKIHDDVFQDGQFVDNHYSSLRKQAFIVAVNCTHPGGNCFCASMTTGPRATSAFDLSLTEIVAEGVHHFVVEVGSDLGQNVLNDVKHRDATREEMQRLLDVMTSASSSMVKTLDSTGIAKMLNENFEHPEWDDVAKRCLACANCTMVCPTCFCSTVEDVTDLTGDHAERWRRWDSCFTSDFTKIAGGNIRMSTRTRYRQWMMHKLSYWENQFGVLGCVGCGRCITWCPVGIDITREAQVIRETSTQTTTQ
jgi:ferredoxin